MLVKEVKGAGQLVNDFPSLVFLDFERARFEEVEKITSSDEIHYNVDVAECFEAFNNATQIGMGTHRAYFSFTALQFELNEV